MKDSFDREINYLRLSVTDLCNLRCRYCMPKNGICKLSHEDVLRIEELLEIVKVFESLGIQKVRLTGGEPLIRRGIIELVESIAKLEGIKDLAITTNGILLKKYAKSLKDAGLNRVNISIDTLRENKFSYITRGGKLKDVLEGIEAAKKVGLSPIKLNIVLIDGFNEDEIEDFAKITLTERIDVRFIELMPIGQVRDFAIEKFINNKIVLEKIPDLIRIPNSELHSPAVYYKIPNSKGRIGFINPISCKFCDSCNKVRVTSQGKLKLCLHSNEEIDLKTPLRQGKNLRDIICEKVKNKPLSHNLEDGTCINKNMVQIGG
ncbi:molybdenum cofactor biosynthesis protein MoeA [Caloranaerobacter sp. TR13]|uniref:GTP 3',8-cyclase MoaA n=1 Tax=Caloranaerobacter sp. TR13 TaxID=1302151 RepID=UPI0006D46051|nr:GTP 3',8-cyclase MoaA [Caloranaerobacter sp. TR13]KPU26722.1 molybdenum cofactor biosynthesis protein MoeA [Caloranaerobacter sp. TR13]